MFIKGENIDIEFLDHINLIEGKSTHIGDSGEYKSFLYETLSEYYENGKIQSDKNLHFFNKIRSASNINFTSEDCIILDEANYVPALLNDLLELIRNTKAYLIIIGRLYLKQLEYSVSAIYSVEYKNERFSLNRTFLPSTNDRSYNVIATEDSTCSNILRDIARGKEVSRSVLFNSINCAKRINIFGGN